MQRWFREFIERLAFRLMSVLCAKVEAQFDLELAELRAGLLERAAEFQGQPSADLQAVAAELTESSARLGQSGAAAADEVDFLEQFQTEHSVKQRKLATVPAKKPAASAAKRGRGRPPKTADSRAPELISDGTSVGESASERCADGQ